MKTIVVKNCSNCPFYSGRLDGKERVMSFCSQQKPRGFIWRKGDKYPHFHTCPLVEENVLVEFKY